MRKVIPGGAFITVVRESSSEDMLVPSFHPEKTMMISDTVSFLP